MMHRDSNGNSACNRTERWSYGRVRLRRVVLVVALLAPGLLFFQRGDNSRSKVAVGRERLTGNAGAIAASVASVSPSRFTYEQGRSPEEIVASKVVAFGKNRRAIVQRLAEHHKKEIPMEVEEFFDAVEAGDWEEIDRLGKAMSKRSAQYEGSTHDEKLDPFWPAVLETYGAAEQAHLWPAKPLLKYSEAILGALRPGMIYVGGTDPGRFIPTLVNETSNGEQHVILTQNAFADSRYQEYVRFLYGDRMQLPVQADMDRAFAEYVSDATRRLEHDEQFPNEPKQIRPREDVRKVDGRVQVSGAVAVMDINERILQSILEKNADLSFAMEESFSMKSTYDGAKPLGPIFELRAGAEPELSAGNAIETIEYWREASAQLMQQSDAIGSPEVLKTWSKMIVSQGNLLSHQQNSREAEETYRLALEMFPRNTDAIIHLSEHLARNGRQDAAREIVTDFGRRNPDLKPDLDRTIPEFK